MLRAVCTTAEEEYNTGAHISIFLMRIEEHHKDKPVVDDDAVQKRFCSAAQEICWPDAALVAEY